ncbi:hypothetical protein MMC13_002764 [Lambiella insularis]|nr:hypothetical protein [Lambiella insularis]
MSKLTPCRCAIYYKPSVLLITPSLLAGASFTLSQRASCRAAVKTLSTSTKQAPRRGRLKSLYRPTQSLKPGIVDHQPLLPAVPAELLNFRLRLGDAELEAVVKSYPNLLKARLLEAEDSGEIARLLHYGLRSQEKLMRSNALDKHVKEFQDHYKKRRLPPHPDASLHLIGYFKESKQYDAGVEFWHWVVKQDNNYVDLRTYGAAIELLAIYGQTLEYCEEVYSHGLKRFPESFNEYHLSPGAIISQRHQPTTLRKTSLTLMQGITRARLIHGHWRSAYMALDTALRLHPTQIPSHFFRIFSEERPVNEAYQIFCLLCQSGSPMKPYDLNWLLCDLVDGQEIGSGNITNIDLALAVINAIRLYAASGHSVGAIHINILFKSFFNLVLTAEAGHGPNATGGSPTLFTTINHIFSIFPLLGTVPNISTYNTVIAAAGRMRNREMLDWARATLSDSEILPNEITLACLLDASSKISGAAGVESVWTSRDPALALTPSLWAALAKATVNVGNVEFLHKQIALHHVPDQKQGNPMRKIQTELASAGSSQPLLARKDEALPEFQSSLTLFFEAIQTFRISLGDPNFHNLKKLPAARGSIWSTDDTVQEEWQKKLYDELSVDPTALARIEAAASTETVGVEDAPVEAGFESTTGFPLDELRYRNWKGINDLLQHAELFEARMEQSVNKAILEGKPSRLARSTRGLRLGGPARQRLLIPQLRQHFDDISHMRANPPTEAEWRTRILHLRRADE